MSWSILPELSAWHAAALLAKGHTGLRADVAACLAPFVGRIETTDIDGQLAALGSADSPSLGESFELYEAVSSVISIDQELATRIGPIKMQWQARGPGMLRDLRRSILGDSTDGGESPVRPSLGAANGEIPILPVYPWVGGFVQPLPSSGAVMVEAVLTDADDALPEAVRLAWGHAQLLSHAALGGAIPMAIHALTTILPTLAAAEQVQLVRCDASTTAKAFELWLQQPANNGVIGKLELWWGEWSRHLNAGAADWQLAVSALGA